VIGVIVVTRAARFRISRVRYAMLWPAHEVSPLTPIPTTARLAFKPP
jgi:hypothetical protein